MYFAGKLVYLIVLPSNQLAINKKDGLTNPQNYNFNQLTWEILMLSKCYKTTAVDRRTLLHVPSGTYWSPAVTLTK